MPVNPYPQRIAELHHWLESRYGQRDREATEILLGALLPREVTGHARPWYIIETDYPSRDTKDAWFSFGGACVATSLAMARIERADPRERMINAWLAGMEAGDTGIFVDAEWRRLAQLTAGKAHPSTLVSSYGLLMSRCMRLRAGYPKGAHALDADRERDRMELARLARRVLDNDHRTETMPRAKDPVPKGMFYWCELLQRLSTLQTDWDAMIVNLAATARNRCTLYNDKDTPPAWESAERVLRDSINFCTLFVMNQAASGAEIKSWDSYMQAGYRMDRAWKEEIANLVRNGVLVKQRGKNRYRLSYGDWVQMTDRSQRMFAPPAG